MDSELERAIKTVTSQIKEGVSVDDALKLSQSALNLANCHAVTNQSAINLANCKAMKAKSA